MQYPSTHNFSPKSRNASSMLVEMRELSTILNIFLEYLSDKHEFCQGTVYSEITKYLEILCIHNQEDKHRITNLSAQVLAADQRFQSNYQYKEMNEQRFAADGKFFRGCIMIKRK